MRTRPGASPSYGGVGLFKSTNGGSSWAPIATAGQIGSRCNKVVVHPTSSSRVFVASNTGVHRGRPAAIGSGYTWENVLGGRATDLVLKHDNPDVMLAGIHNDGVYKTVDGGDHWTRLTGDRVVVFAIIIVFRENFPTGADAGLDQARDRALRRGRLGLRRGQARPGLGDHAHQHRRGGAVAQDARQRRSRLRRVVQHGRRPPAADPAHLPRQRRHEALLRRAGTTADSPGTHSDHHQMVFHHSNNDVAYVCNDGGVYRTTNNGSSWHLRS